jgi:hypothetical protein
MTGTAMVAATGYGNVDGNVNGGGNGEGTGDGNDDNDGYSLW